MTRNEAISFITNAVPHAYRPQRWADLGCGSGTFTDALAYLLPSGSHIYAVDNEVQNLPTTMGNDVSVEFVKMDFEKSEFKFSNFDGVLMANSLHFVKDKLGLFKQLEGCFSSGKKFVIIEYDTNIPNLWVPYPLSFNDLKALFTLIQHHEIVKVAERQSRFGGGNMYAALIQLE